MSVIVSRALPDVRDGLKLCIARILYAMKRADTIAINLIKIRPHRRRRHGKYHPHGDAAIYDAMVRMAQDFSMRLPLIDRRAISVQEVDGDPPAAMHVTPKRGSPKQPEQHWKISTRKRSIFS